MEPEVPAVEVTWARLFSFEPPHLGTHLSVGGSWIVLGVTSAIALLILFRRVRAYEIVR